MLFIIRASVKDLTADPDIEIVKSVLHIVDAADAATAETDFTATLYTNTELYEVSAIEVFEPVAVV